MKNFGRVRIIQTYQHVYNTMISIQLWSQSSLYGKYSVFLSSFVYDSRQDIYGNRRLGEKGN